MHRLRRPIICLSLAVTLIVPLTGVAAAQPGRVTGFTLIDARNDRPIPGFDPMPQDAILDLAALPTRQLNIRVNTTRAVDAVRIALNGRLRVEKEAPYAVAGSRGENFAAWTPRSGDHRVRATPLTDGQESRSATLRFVVVDGRDPGEPVEPVGPVGVGGESGSGPSPCGAIPAAPAGWQREVSSTFSETTRLGSWPGPIAERDWHSRLAGYRDSSGRGIYNSAKTVSEHDGLLDIWIHSEGGQRYVAAPIPKLGDTFGQRISVCMRADRIPGYKLAFLLWPDEGPGNHHGEINFPEGKLTPTGEAFGFMHYDPKPSSGKQQDAYNTRTSSVDWHRYTLEWDPGAAGSQSDDYVAFYLDGRLVGRSTGAEVPDGPMHYIMQIETYLAGQELDGHPEGHVQLDWVTIDVPTGGRNDESDG